VFTGSIQKLTQWGVLEGKDDEITHFLERGSPMGSGETLCDGNPDSTVYLCRIPTGMAKNLIMELRKPQNIWIPILVQQICLESQYPELAGGEIEKSQ
jgi:hypothetical protein